MEADRRSSTVLNPTVKFPLFTNASPQFTNAPLPQKPTSQQPSAAPSSLTYTHTDRGSYGPLSGIRASFWQVILTSWHRSSIPQSPCKTLSLTARFTSQTTANALVTILQHTADHHQEPPIAPWVWHSVCSICFFLCHHDFAIHQTIFKIDCFCAETWNSKAPLSDYRCFNVHLTEQNNPCNPGGKAQNMYFVLWIIPEEQPGVIKAPVSNIFPRLNRQSVVISHIDIGQKGPANIQHKNTNVSLITQ